MRKSILRGLQTEHFGEKKILIKPQSSENKHSFEQHYRQSVLSFESQNVYNNINHENFHLLLKSFSQKMPPHTTQSSVV